MNDRPSENPAVTVSAPVLSDLASIEGVEAVTVDPEGGALHLICRSGVVPESSPVELQARAILVAAPGAREDRLPAIRISYLGPPEPRRRVAVENIEVHVVDVRRVEASVGLEWDGRLEKGVAAGPPAESADVRLPAEATLDGLSRIVGEPLEFRLLGIKVVRAFDHDMVVALVRPAVGPAGKLVGVAIADDGVRVAAVRAVLNATNRLLGNYLSVGD